MQKFTRYYEAISFLEGLSNLPMRGDYMIDRTNLDDYLNRINYFLDLLGNPQDGQKYIHITGTAGKGSVTNMLHEILLAAGKNVGSFTSPFVTTTIEKIKVGNLYISPDEFADIVEEMKPHINYAYLHSPYGKPSYFEIILAVGFVYFKRKKCDWVVLEVGCGGRYDATNVIKNPVVTAITNIDYDHMELIGPTLEDVAYEKAGIIKKNSKFFTSEQRPKFKKFFKETCEDVGASFAFIPHQDSYDAYNKKLTAEIAISLDIPAAKISEGIKKSRLQCRFEIMQKKPLVILDGAHNKIKVKSTVDNLKKTSFKKLITIIGIADSKEHASILSRVVPISDRVFFTRFQIKDRKCAHPKELLQKSKRHLKRGVKTEVLLDCHQALSTALAKAGPHDAILVVGSFFLAGELRKKWMSEEDVLSKRKAY
jgi:dihydrofolate synthase/folylpolyglutamate synthase